MLTELRCEYDPLSTGGNPADGRKIKGTIHWVAAQDAIEAKIRLYEHLFNVPNPDEMLTDENLASCLNPNSLQEVTGLIEPALAKLANHSSVQFERLGYFSKDPDSREGQPVFNRTVTLRDSWKQ